MSTDFHIQQVLWKQAFLSPFSWKQKKNNKVTHLHIAEYLHVWTSKRKVRTYRFTSAPPSQAQICRMPVLRVKKIYINLFSQSSALPTGWQMFAAYQHESPYIARNKPLIDALLRESNKERLNNRSENNLFGITSRCQKSDFSYWTISTFS